MGHGYWDAVAYCSSADFYATKSVKETFTNSVAKKELKPVSIKMRESRDSEAHPKSNAIILALDVTGSMGHIAHDMVKGGLGKVMSEIFFRGVVTDPQIATMAVGDIYCDTTPLQVTQFESDIQIANQLTSIYVEGGGGGNNFESYNLPWIFAAKKTSIDCWEKRGEKGYLFTIGDEEVPQEISVKDVKVHVGTSIKGKQVLTSKAALKMAQESYNVFHVVIEEGNYARSRVAHVEKVWRTLMGDNVLMLSDHKKLPEVIISAMQITEGKDTEEVINSWDNETSAVVRHAVQQLKPPDVQASDGSLKKKLIVKA